MSLSLQKTNEHRNIAFIRHPKNVWNNGWSFDEMIWQILFWCLNFIQRRLRSDVPFATMDRHLDVFKFITIFNKEVIAFSFNFFPWLLTLLGTILIEDHRSIFSNYEFVHKWILPQKKVQNFLSILSPQSRSTFQNWVSSKLWLFWFPFLLIFAEFLCELSNLWVSIKLT